VTRRGRLLDRIRVLESDLQTVVFPHPPISFQLRGGAPNDHPDDDITLQRRTQRDGSHRWVVYRFGTSYALNRDGQWEYEPIPSSRDDAYLARTRFATLMEAYECFRQYSSTDFAKLDRVIKLCNIMSNHV
jgi:hypothetical protein